MGNNALFMTFVAPVVFNPFGSIISDNLGRKAFFLIATIVNILGSILSLAKQSYWPIVLGISIQFISKKLLNEY